MLLQKFRVLAIAGFASMLVSPHAWAVVVWNETTNGDLSGDRLAPTQLTLSAGTNSVSGSMTFTDKEYFTINVPTGSQFTGLNLAGYEGDDFVAFMGVAAGTQMPVPPDTPSAAGLMGWMHVGDFALNQDILPAIGQGTFGATGFTPPLPSGSYTFWWQQIDGLLVTYQLDFLVSAISTPGDYNHNGSVDAGDYPVWRKSNGLNVTVGTGADGSGPGGTPDGVVDAFDYQLWRSNFGKPPGAGSDVGAAIPEPATAGLVVVLAVTIAMRHARLRRHE